MNYYTNQQIDEQLDTASASEAIRCAYLEWHRGDSAVQVRSRIALPEAKFSSMSAMLSGARIAAVKMYTTLGAQFRFFIALLSIYDGALLNDQDLIVLTGNFDTDFDRYLVPKPGHRLTLEDLLDNPDDVEADLSQIVAVNGRGDMLGYGRCTELPCATFLLKRKKTKCD